MTKIRVMSDLHLEFGPLHIEPAGEDVLALVGDIGIYTDGIVWARDYARRTDIPVVMIAGNHEFYRNPRHPAHTVESTLAALRAFAESEPLLTFLEDDIATVAGVLFVGATLWTDFDLFGNAPMATIQAQRRMNDYYKIWETDRERLLPAHTRKRHEFSVGWLRESVPRNYQDGTPLVVMTHHLPTARSVAGRYADDTCSPAYASNLDDLVEASGAALWCHGHTHISWDYQIGATRIICNPRGYAGYEVNPNFDPTLIIEI